MGLAILALASSTAQSGAPPVRGEANEEPGSRPETQGAGTSLPPHALLQIGTRDLRTPSNIRSCAISPDGRLVAAGDLHAPDTRITIFDVRSGRQVKQLVTARDRSGWFDTAAFSPDGSKLLGGEMSGEVALWDLPADRLLYRQKLHGGNVLEVKFSPNGRSFATSGLDGAIHLRSVEKPDEVVRVFTWAKGGSHLAFTPDGTRLVASGQFTTMIRVWRLSDGQLVREIGPTDGNHLKSMAVTPDSRNIPTAGHRQEEKEDPEEREEGKRAERPREVRVRGIGPGEPKRLTVKRTEIRLWDIDSGEKVRDLDGAEEIGIGDVALSPDGRRMVIVDFQTIRMLDASTLEPQWAIDLPGWWGRPVEFSYDAKFAVLPEQNAVVIFEVATGRRLHHDASTPVGRIGAAAWSPSGDRIVTGHSDGLVRVWDAVTGGLIWHQLMAPIVSVGGASADPTSIGFSRNGKLVVAAGRRDAPPNSAQAIVVAFEAANGRVAREVPQGWVELVAPAPDRRMLVVARHTCLVGIEAVTGQTRWQTPTVTKPETRVQPVALQFEASPVWFQAALKDGNVIRCNGLTGREDRRFLADGRSPAQQKGGRPEDTAISAAAFSADGRTMAASSGGCVCVWDVAAGSLRRRIPYPHARDCVLALAPDGKTVATSDAPNERDFGEDQIRLYDVETGEPMLTLEPENDRAHLLAFSPDGTKLLAGFQRGSVLVWDVRQGASTRPK
jgi:WD40 repeat protein